MAAEADGLRSLVSEELAARTAEALDRIDLRQRDEKDLALREGRLVRLERSLRDVHEPRRLNFAMMARRAPRIAQLFMEDPAKQVPPEFWQRDGDEAIVACPCEEEPRVPLQAPVTCECGRMFVFDGDQVRVLPAAFFEEPEQPS